MYTLNWQVYSDYAMLHVFCMYGIPKYTPQPIHCIQLLLYTCKGHKGAQK